MRSTALITLALSAVACRSAVPTVGSDRVHSEPGTTEELEIVHVPGATIPEAPLVTFSLNFDGGWDMATFTCWDNYQPVMYAAEFDQEGWAKFTADFTTCSGILLNVAKGSLTTGLIINANPNVIGEIVVDEMSDNLEMEDPDLAPVLHLWVFEGEYEWGVSEMLDPITQNDPDGSFWGCDEPIWLSPYGMPYGRPPPYAEDYCETTPP